MRELIDRLRVLEQDHEPDGWPAVRMRDITALVDALEAAQRDACLMLVADIRFACGDNGKRMQPELVEFIRGLAEDAAKWRALDAAATGEVVEVGDDESGQPRVLIHTSREELKRGPPLFKRVRIVPTPDTTEGGDRE